jgi:alkylhydroperoxidase family enzyme
MVNMSGTRAEVSSAIITGGLASCLHALEDAFARFAMELYGSLLPRRFRELLILHTAWHAESELLWTAHFEVARSTGISDVQVAAIQQGQIEAFVFNSEERALLHILSRQAWGGPTLYFNPEQIDQICMTERFYLNIAINQSYCARGTDTFTPASAEDRSGLRTTKTSYVVWE